MILSFFGLSIIYLSHVLWLIHNLEFSALDKLIASPVGAKCTYNIYLSVLVKYKIKSVALL